MVSFLERFLEKREILKIGETQILDTFAEAFRMRCTRLIVTAHDVYWLRAAVQELCGYGSSVIACDAEISVERWLAPEESPDARIGAAVLAFGFSVDALAKAVANRVGQCVMTAASTAVFNGCLDAETSFPLGKRLRYFGDGFQKSKVLGGRRFWRIPVMEGEFLCEEKLGTSDGVAGGNLILQAADQVAALDAARRGVEAVAEMPDVITPFPGGVARSGSKVGSRYAGLRASTAEAYCPTLKSRVDSQLVAGAHCALEIIFDGTSQQAVLDAMQAALYAIAGPGILAIGAGNYGGKLGKFHLHLKDLIR